MGDWEAWTDGPGAVRLPDGAWLRGRGLRAADPSGPPPEFGLYLGVDPRPPWPWQRVDWPDFRLPRDPDRALQRLRHVHGLAMSARRVEIACGGGHGRTGTAIAVLAVLAGVPADGAVAWTRAHYDRRAVETPWQRRWVRRLPELLATS